MNVYVVYYDEVTRGREDPEEDRRIHGVYDSAEKAHTAVRELQRKYGFDANFESYEVE
jgi:hypothetical protein